MNLLFFQNHSEIFAVKYKKQIDQQLIDKLIYYIQSATKKSPRVIVEINGTINSLLAGAIFKKAVPDKVIAIIVDFNTPKTTSLTHFCTNLGLNTYLLNRTAAYQNELSAYQMHNRKDISNFYTRFTNYHLLTAAAQMRANLVDTEDKSERLTILRPQVFYGSIMPFYSLYKTEIYELAKFLNIPTEISDENRWKNIDPILYLLTEKQVTPEEISEQFKIDLKWLKKLKIHTDKQLLETTVSQFMI